MDGTEPKQPPAPPVARLARSLLACADQDPLLLCRSRILAEDSLPAPVWVPATLPLPARRTEIEPLRIDGAGDRSAYMEELVSLAVAAAQQAEDAERHAQRSSTMARRGRLACVAFGLVGIVIGIAGAVDSHIIGSASPVIPAAQQEVAPAPATNTPTIEASQAPPPAPAAPIVEEPAAPLKATPVSTRPAWSIESPQARRMQDVSPILHPTQWPAYQPPPPRRRIVRMAPTPQPPQVLARLVANLRRDVRVLFQ